MATVRFSQELKDRIFRNARQMFEKRIAAAENARPDQSWGMRIYDELFGKYANELAAVPEGFMRYADDFSVQRVGEQHAGNISFDLPTQMPWPDKFNSTTDKATVNYSNTINLVYPEDADGNRMENLLWDEFAAECKRWRDGIQAVKDKQNEFVQQVATLIENYATLAPALKAWPPLWDLIPEDVKNKHKEVVVREKKQVEHGLDLSALTATSVAIKIGG